MKCLRTITVHEFESAVEGTHTCIACHCYTCVHACTSVFCPHALSTVHVVKMYGCVQWMCVCMSYSPGSDDKPGGGTQVLIAIHM